MPDEAAGSGKKDGKNSASGKEELLSTSKLRILKNGNGKEYIKYGMSIIKILNYISVYPNHCKYKLFSHIQIRNTQKSGGFFR
jgi:tryptophan synthase beta subunit